jgi:hypothetical protein
VQGSPRLRLLRRRSPNPEGRGPGPSQGERGFVLIAAIWLLILAGSIAAILMLRSLASATAAAEHEEAAERRLALESATETMLADRLFNGNRSAWWLTPSESSIAIGRRRILLRVTSESGRLDVNMADPALIDTALRGFGLGAAERARIVARLVALRATKRRIGSLAELAGLSAAAGARACLPDQLTYVSGLAEPRPDQVSGELGRALGGRGGAGAPAAPEGGAALRVEAREAGGAAIVSIVRLSGLAERPMEVSAWGEPSPCAPASGLGASR